MVYRDEKIQEEALALWLALFKQPPAIRADGSQIIEAVVQTLPKPAYPQAPSAKQD